MFVASVCVEDNTSSGVCVLLSTLQTVEIISWKFQKSCIFYFRFVDGLNMAKICHF